MGYRINKGTSKTYKTETNTLLVLKDLPLAVLAALLSPNGPSQPLAESYCITANRQSHMRGSEVPKYVYPIVIEMYNIGCSQRI